MRLVRPCAWVGALRNTAYTRDPASHTGRACEGRMCRNPECGPVDFHDSVPAGTVGTIVRQAYPVPQAGGPQPGGTLLTFVPDDPSLRSREHWCYSLGGHEKERDQYASAGLEKI